jgi:large subunit ribosomal protein L25
VANYQLAVEKRDKIGSSFVKKLRREDKVPGIVYGAGKETMPITVDLRALERALADSSTLINLTIGDEAKTVIVRDVQYDPVKGNLLHVDFHEVALDQKIETVVPIRVINEDQRPSDGGVVTPLLWEVTVECLPTDIPEAIEVDVKDLELGTTLVVRDIALPEGVAIVTDPEEAVVKVDLPTAVEEPADVEAGEGEPADEADSGAAEE